MRTRGPPTPGTSPWQAGLGHGHTCSGVGGELPGLQLLVPRTDMASPATAGPEAPEPGEPGAQASPAWDQLQGLQMLGDGGRRAEEGRRGETGGRESCVRQSAVSPAWPLAAGRGIALPWAGGHLHRLLGPPPPGVTLLTGMMSSVPWSARSLFSDRVSPVQVPPWEAQEPPEAAPTPSKGWHLLTGPASEPPGGPAG